MNLVLVLVPTSTHTSPTIRTILLRSCQGGDRGFQVKQVIGKADSCICNLHSISIIFSKPFVVYSHKNYLLCPEKSSPFLVDKVEYPRPVDFQFIPPTHHHTNFHFRSSTLSMLKVFRFLYIVIRNALVAEFFQFPLV